MDMVLPYFFFIYIINTTFASRPAAFMSPLPFADL